MMRLILVIFILFALPVQALEDTTENRRIEAERYIVAADTKQMLSSMADGLAMNMKPEDRDGFRQMMTKFVNIDVINNASLESMVKHFTIDELSALADFYDLPVAKTAMLKMGVYMAEIMPVIQAEMLRAAGEVQLAQAALNRQMPDQKSTTADAQ
jgi:hypothetical protein